MSERSTALRDAAALLRKRASQLEQLSSSDYDNEGFAAHQLHIEAGGLDRLADEAPSTGWPAVIPASTAPLAARLPLVRGRCPVCGTSSLFLGNGGYVTCSQADCTEPEAASTALEREPGCAHCGGPHRWDDCQAYTALVASETAAGRVDEPAPGAE